eukprot:gene9117-1418_t
MERAASGHGSGHGVGNGRGRGSSGGRSSFQGSNRDDRGGRRASYLSRGGKIGIGRGRGGASESNNLNSIGRSSSAGHRRGHRGGRGGRGNWVRSRGARGSSNSSSSSVGQGRNNRGDYNDDGSAGYGSNKAMRGRGGGNRGRGSKRTGLRSDLKKPSKLSEVKQKGLNARHARDSIDISKGVINSNQPKVRPLRPQKSKADSQTNEAAVKYKLTHRILIVGDGDFSFSHGLVRHLGGDGSNIVATSHDSRKKVIDKYNMSDTHLSDLTASGCRIVHGIDAGDLHNHFPKQANYFHRVIFNFPHTGLQRVHLNKDLIRRFLISAPYVLHPNGQIHITIKMSPPYSGWDLPGSGKNAGLIHPGTLDFDSKLFPGYSHQTTLADAKTFDAATPTEASKCKTLVFMKAKDYKPRVQPSTASLQQAEEIKQAISKRYYSSVLLLPV